MGWVEELPEGGSSHESRLFPGGAGGWRGAALPLVPRDWLEGDTINAHRDTSLLAKR